MSLLFLEINTLFIRHEVAAGAAKNNKEKLR